ncbi:phage head closure protein [Oceanobacter sp. 3_MG-2023]|uniref:phage head closure protein n=1 Tax=Oceanobacter sp. 3_MG-2023 TaxID=3062622 RepID=UPI0027347298|nr:phage head closure protein [Oceanobacter sp. 3_MG-2023]MDP2505387.1 phage head closure protein [Oceanobacter sp. 3_MG-2023]
MIGILDTYATIEQPVQTRNELNENETIWQELEPVWCRLQAGASGEGSSNDTQTVTAGYTVTTHYTPDVTQEMRLNIDGTLYNITAVDHPFRAKTVLQVEYTSYGKRAD